MREISRPAKGLLASRQELSLHRVSLHLPPPAPLLLVSKKCSVMWVLEAYKPKADAT